MNDYINLWPTIIGSIGAVIITALITVYSFREEIQQKFEKNNQNLNIYYKDLLGKINQFPDSNNDLKEKGIYDVNLELKKQTKLREWIDSHEGYQCFRKFLWTFTYNIWNRYFQEHELPYKEDPYPLNPFLQIKGVLNKILEAKPCLKGTKQYAFLSKYNDPDVQEKLESYFDELTRLGNWLSRLYSFIKILYTFLKFICFYILMIFFILLLKVFNLNVLTLSAIIFLSVSFTMLFFYIISIFKGIESLNVSGILTNMIKKKKIIVYLFIIPLIVTLTFCIIIQINPIYEKIFEISNRNFVKENNAQIKLLNKKISEVNGDLSRLGGSMSDNIKILSKINEKLSKNSKSMFLLRDINEKIDMLRKSIIKMNSVFKGFRLLENGKTKSKQSKNIDD